MKNKIALSIICLLGLALAFNALLSREINLSGKIEYMGQEGEAHIFKLTNTGDSAYFPGFDKTSPYTSVLIKEEGNWVPGVSHVCRTGMEQISFGSGGEFTFSVKALHTEQPWKILTQLENRIPNSYIRKFYSFLDISFKHKYTVIESPVMGEVK